MLLRTRQRQFVDNINIALRERKNTIGVAPTGAGKTIMMAAVCVENKPKDLPSLVLQHRDELVSQNREKFIKYAGIRNIRRPMTIDADNKAWDRGAGGWNFGMIQTVHGNMDAMPPLGLLAIDEAHRSAANTYLEVIARAKTMNPNILIYGTTATPNRGDRRALRTVFDNCGDQIQIGELIHDGHLVKPRTFVVDIGINEELRRTRRTAIDFDMKEVEGIMNKAILNEKIIEHWRGFTDLNGNWISCANRQTVIFCSTTQHGKDVTAAFKDAGIVTEFVGDNMAKGKRRDILAKYDQGEIQVIVNVAILTEGWDHQPTSAVILLRPASWKSTMTQMIGRGLRKVDPEIYPGVIKDDCIVLDFGTSCLTHGSLEDEVDLRGSGYKLCPDCLSNVPKSSKECPICAHEFPPEDFRKVTTRSTGGGDSNRVQQALTNFVMTEIDILQDSPFKYEAFFDGRVMLCFGFTYWAAVVHYQDGRFYAIGAESLDENAKNYKLHVLNSSNSYLMALQSADDYMRTKGNNTDAKRVAQWLYSPPTSKQLEILGRDAGGGGFSMTKYRASCAIQFKFYKNQLRNAIEGMKHAAEEINKRHNI